MPKTTKPAVDAFDPTIVKGQQDVIATLFAKIGEYKVRIKIRSDFYAFQSYARIEVWRQSSLDWSGVHALQYQKMKTPAGLYSHGTVPSAVFRHDVDELMRVAREILL